MDETLGELEVSQADGLSAKQNLAALETQFRIGALHGANWFRQRVKVLAANGLSGTEISTSLGTLLEVLMDWRNNQVDMPTNNPWEWSQENLEAFINERKEQW